jgi:hypothetical protein
MGIASQKRKTRSRALRERSTRSEGPYRRNPQISRREELRLLCTFGPRYYSMPKSTGTAQPRAPSKEQLRELKKLGNATIALYRLLEQDRNKPYQYHQMNKDRKIVKTFECRKCKENSATYKKPHALFCPINKLFGKTHDQVLDEQRLAESNRPVKDGPVASYGIQQALAKQKAASAATQQTLSVAKQPGSAAPNKLAPAAPKKAPPAAPKKAPPAAAKKPFPAAPKKAPPAAPKNLATPTTSVTAPKQPPLPLVKVNPYTGKKLVPPLLAPPPVAAKTVPDVAVVVERSPQPEVQPTAALLPSSGMSVPATAAGQAPLSLCETVESLKAAIQDFMANESNKPDWKSVPLPLPIIAIFRYLQSKCPAVKDGKIIKSTRSEVNDKKMAWWRANFRRGCVKFTLPRDHCDGVTVPDRYYHAVEGAELFLSRWEFAAPDLVIPCPEADCNGVLVASPPDLSRPAAYTRIVDANNIHIYAIASVYKCSNCSTSLHGNSAKVLHALPDFLKLGYPVDPRFGSYTRSTPWQFHLSVTRQFDYLGVVHVPAHALIKSLYVAYGRQYEDCCRDYYSQLAFGWTPGLDDGTEVPCYITWEQYCGGKLVLPDSDALLKQMERAFQSGLTPSGVSDYDRCNREMQSVECRVALTVDHTFAAVANYNKQALAAMGAGNNVAMLTVMTETNEVPCVAMVPSTALSDAAHAVQQLSERPHFVPLGIWYDIYPKGMAFWRQFWEKLLGHLGGYHWGQRISDTLRQRHPQFRRALLDLSKCVYTPHPDDERAVEDALLSGTMSGGKADLEDIVLMKRDGTFKRRYGQFIRSTINHATTIRTKLTDWYARYKASKSEGSKLPAEGQRSERDGTSLFTPETYTAFHAGLESCEHLPDKIPFEKVYRKHNPPPGAKHGLPTYRAHRGESNLESMHHSLAHYGNTNMRPAFADMFMLLGLTRFNCQARERLRVGQMTAEEMLAIPAHQRGNPLHLDHSSLAYINALARQAGLLEPHFRDVHALPKDNGERFLSQYLEKQLECN